MKCCKEFLLPALQAIQEGRLGYAIVTASKATKDNTVRRQLIAGISLQGARRRCSRQEMTDAVRLSQAA
jgi:hypothetical protein